MASYITIWFYDQGIGNVYSIAGIMILVFYAFILETKFEVTNIFRRKSMNSLNNYEPTSNWRPRLWVQDQD